MKIQVESFMLNNGIRIPSIGIGPGMTNRNLKLYNFKSFFLNRLYRAFYHKIIIKLIIEKKYISAVSHSLQIGYRLIDNSVSYGNEKLIGKAIKRSGVKREDLFITTRVSNRQQLKGNIREQFMKSLSDLSVDYVDLYMFHWPVTNYYLSTWEQMIELYNEGLVKTLGVANCHQHHLEEILNYSNVVPAINQLEVHPLITQKSLIEYCKTKGIIVEAYTPIARNDDRLVRNRILEEIGKKYNKSIQQVVLRWHIQNGLIPVPRSLNKQRQIENISVFDFFLTSKEIDKIDSININARLRYDPDNCDFTRL